MKLTQPFFAVLFLLVALQFTFQGLGQQAVYFAGKNQCLSFSGAEVPSGNSKRTVEFWMRSSLRTDAFQNHGSIIELGTQGENGSTFGIFSEVKDNKTYLSLWAHNAGERWMFALPDDEWHFIAATYDGYTFVCYLDGIVKYQKEIRLNTQSGTCYIGGKPERDWYFKGSIRSVSIWNTVRTQAQVQSDMVPYFGTEAPHILKATEPGLVYHFPLNEGTGTTFSALGERITGTFVNNPEWTTPIASNPSPIDDGIWFFIQNKADVDTDTELVPRRLAMSVNSDNQVVMAPIPFNYTEDYDAWLWRTLPINGNPNRVKLINKKLGTAYAMDCSLTNPTIGAIGAYTGQEWALTQANLANYGTNVYTMYNNYITEAKALAYNERGISVQSKTANTTNQAWVFQPVKLSLKYHIPGQALDQYPTSKKLTSSYGVDYYATYTCSDWSILNTHLINNNQMNALKVSRDGLRGQRLYVISRYDYSADDISTYPKVGIPAAWIGATRGGEHPGHNLTMVTEEMMCRRGVFSRIVNARPDIGYREFDQVVHEFGHTIDVFTHQNGGNTPSCALGDPKECYAASIQAWFNSNYSYPSLPRTRSIMKSNFLPLYNYVGRAFNESNTWLPARFVHQRIAPHVITSGTTIRANDVYSYSSFNTAYVLRLQKDGNMVISQNGGFRWGSFNNLNVPLTVASMTFANGYLIFNDAEGNEVAKKGTPLSAKSSLIIRSTSSGPQLQVLDVGGTVRWTSNQ